MLEPIVGCGSHVGEEMGETMLIGRRLYLLLQCYVLLI